MKKTDKSEVVATLHDRFARARIAIVSECAGMPVNQVNDLRKKLRRSACAYACGKEYVGHSGSW